MNTVGLSYRLIVVDDKSPDQAEMAPIYSTLESNGSASQVVRHPQNAGFPTTCNDGAARGNAPAILFLNTDVMLQAGAIRAMLNTLWSDSVPQAMIAPHEGPVGVVGPKLLFPESSTPQAAGKIQHAGMGFDLAGRAIHLNIGWSSEHPKVNMLRGLQMVTGACLMTRRETWRSVTEAYRAVGDPSGGGFNLVYGRGTYEDLEYCFAARGNGFRVVYEPKAVGHHHVGASAFAEGEQGYTLQRNDSIFKARCGHLMLWDEWMFY